MPPEIINEDLINLPPDMLTDDEFFRMRAGGLYYNISEGMNGEWGYKGIHGFISAKFLAQRYNANGNRGVHPRLI